MRVSPFDSWCPSVQSQLTAVGLHTGCSSRSRMSTGVRPATPRPWIAENQPALGDLGYEGEADTITVTFKNPKNGQLTDEQKTHN
jgi:hypothetical protein